MVMETLDDRRLWSVSLGDLTKAKCRRGLRQVFSDPILVPMEQSICHSHELTLVLAEKTCKGKEGGYFFRGPGRCLSWQCCLALSEMTQSRVNKRFTSWSEKNVSSPRLHKILQEAPKTNYCFLSTF